MTLRLGLIQTPVLHDLDAVAALLDTLRAEEPALWLLPELFLDGFAFTDLQAQAAHAAQALRLGQEFCRATGHALAGTFLEEQAGRHRNALYLLDPAADRPRQLCAKQHLFPLSDEARLLAPGGPEFVSTNWRGLRLGGMICYDLRFPEVARAQAASGLDLLLIPAQWPTARLAQFQALCRARAIENQAFALCCDACGDSVLGPMPGRSALYGPTGETLLELGDAPQSKAVTVDAGLLARARERFDTTASPAFEVIPRR